MHTMDKNGVDPRYTVRHATLSDKAAVLGMNVLVYGGSFDYLPGMYDGFIRSWNTYPVVCEFKGKVVGFNFYYLIDGGETVVSRGVRVDVDHQGKGVANLMHMNILEEILNVKQNLRVKNRASTILVDKAHSNLTKKYKHVFCETFCSFSTSNRGSEILRCFQHGDLPYPDFGRLIQLNKPQIQSLLLSPDIYQKLFYDDTVIINWVPYKCKASNIRDILESQNLTIFADATNRVENYNSVSFGCTVYVLSGNNMRYDVHIYAKDKDMINVHLVAQIYSAATTHEKYNIHFEIAVQAPVTRQSITDILHKIGMVENTFHQCNDPQMLGVVIPIKELVERYAKFIKLPSLQ